MANRDHFNEYSSALDHNVVMAQATLTSIFNSFTSDMSVRDIKKNLRELYPALVREYGDRAAQVALEYYESERTAYLKETEQDDDLYNPGIPNGVPLQYLHKDVDDTCARYHVKKQPESVYTALSGAASNRIMKMSDSTLAHAMKGDILRPKWALVSRLLSCSWCSMISSFGFHYNSAYNVEKARHKPNPTACRCSVCVDFNHDDPRLKGYDPDKMYYRFSAIADKLGIDFTRENQANSKARKRILREFERMRRRESKNLPRNFSCERGARPSEKELRTANRLSKHGIKGMFRATREVENKKTSDLIIDEKAWEIKQPHGHGKNNINNQFNEARGQARNLIIDASTSPFSYEDVCVQAEACLIRRNDFDEVIIVNDESIKKLKK